MRIGEREIGPGEPPYVIAELGVNHDGDVDQACSLVDAAARAGADAIKLQLYDTERLLSRDADGGNRRMLDRLQLTVDQMRPVVDHARRRGLGTIVTVFNVVLVPDAACLRCDAYKVASPDLVNKPLIESLLQTGVPVLLSTGAATLDEARAAAGWVADHPHVLMQCVSAYPTPDHEAALAGREALEAIDPWALGYSDHTASVHAGGFAVAAGSRVLEKHLTHDRSAPGPDHAASLDPSGFAEYVRLVRLAWSMLGPPEKRVLPIEDEVRRLSRQSLVTTRPVKKDEKLTVSDLAIKRPGGGLSPALLDDVIGRVVAHPLEADEPITEDHLA